MTLSQYNFRCTQIGLNEGMSLTFPLRKDNRINAFFPLHLLSRVTVSLVQRVCPLYTKKQYLFVYSTINKKVDKFQTILYNLSCGFHCSEE